MSSLHVMVYARYVCGRSLECCEIVQMIVKQVGMLSEGSIAATLITTSHNVIRGIASCRRLLTVCCIGIHELCVSVLIVSLRSVAVRIYSLYSGITGRSVTNRLYLYVLLPPGYAVYIQLPNDVQMCMNGFVWMSLCL
jgi:hypothetical protein